MGVMAWAPLGNFFSDKNEQQKRIQKSLKPLMEKYKAEQDELLLAWLMQHPAHIYPVIGTTDKNRIKKSVKAAEIKLEEIDWFSLLVASQGHKMP
jgi:predicted oxidoreductase